MASDLRPDLHIRSYAMSDIPKLIELVRESLPQLPNYKGLTIDDTRLRFLLANNDRNASFMCTVLVDDHDVPVGGLAAQCSPTIFSLEVIANDILMYIQPKHRSLRSANMLIRTYIEWARARKAVLVLASHTGGVNAPGMDVMLKRLGFDDVGHLYHLRERS